MTYSGYPATYSQKDLPFLAQAGVSPGRAGRKGLGFFSSRSAVMLAVETNKTRTDTRDKGVVMLEKQSSDLLRVES